MIANSRKAAAQLRRLLRLSNVLEDRQLSGITRGSDISNRPFSSAFPLDACPLDRSSSSVSRESRSSLLGSLEGGWGTGILSNGAMVQQVRGVKVSGSEVKIGFVIERKGRIEKVLKAQHTTQGRGGATIQVELRDVQTGLKSTARLRTSEAIENVFVEDRHYTFLYEEGETVFLMDPATFEQLEVPKTYFDQGAVYLTDGLDVTVQYFDGKPLSAAVPSRVTCTVAEAEPYFKGQTATPSYKKVVLENGQLIMAPTFISSGDIVIVNTTDDSYVTRSKS